MIDAVAHKFLAIILGLIESNDARHVEMLEDLQVVLRRVAAPLELTNIIKWAHEGNKFVRDNPVEVAVLDFLIVFVLLVVKLAEIVPAEFNRELETLQAMLNSARIRAV